MKTIDNLISKEMFLNAFKICKSYMDNPRLVDINMLLLKDSFQLCSEKKVEEFYDKYIKDDKFYCNQVFFSNDIVQIPKGINNFREYRFFDMYSMILYNAIGILFYKLCNKTFKSIGEKCDEILTFSPTKFSDVHSNKKYIEVKANNDYAVSYNQYSKAKKENIVPGTCIIKIDVSKYFDSIIHKKLIELIEKYSLASTLSEYDINKESYKALNFYFDSMMNSNIGIPQGRDNCFSDYFGDIYMKEFDFTAQELCKSELIHLKRIIRYVDDITIVYDLNPNLDNAQHYKELSKIEQKISKFFTEKLNLIINPNKTEYSIFKSAKEVNDYIKKNSKKVSSKNDIIPIGKIEENYQKFKRTLEKFKFNSEESFKFKLTDEDKEVLKLVFEKSFISYIQKENIILELNEIIKHIDLELTMDYMYILIIFIFLTKNNKKLYFPSFKENISKNLNFNDKRTIHIAMLCYTQDYSLSGLKNQIKKSQLELTNDNYGKYLLTLANARIREDVSFLNNNSIFENITWRYMRKKRERNFVYESKNIYNIMTEKLISTINTNEAQIQQIKDFVFYYRKEEWNLAYNSFYNFFHETCKIAFNNQDDKYTIQSMIEDLKKSDKINQESNLYLIKFADYRNFNTISHPSKNGKISIKVSKEVLDEYIDRIGNIIIDIL